MKVRILAWESEGLRGALENLAVELSAPEKSNVLIQMPTGTGKTTTMSLFRKAISGADFTSEEILNLRAESKPSTGHFSVTLDLDEIKVKIIIKFNFQRKRFSYTTVRTPGGNTRGHQLPRPYDRLLTHALARLFIFDGELAAELRNQQLTEADQAVEALYRLSVLESIGAYADETLELKRQKNEYVQGVESNVVTIHTNRRDEAAKSLKKLERKHKRELKNQAEVGGELKSVSEEIEELAARSSELENEFQHANDVVVRAASALNERHGTVCAQFTHPQRLHPKIIERLSSCYDQFEAARLPGSSSSEWFEWLSQQEECICGRSISALERDVIRSHKEHYLGGDRYALINEIKFALKAATHASPIDAFLIQELDDSTANFRRAVQHRTEVENRRVQEAGGDIDSLREQEHALTLKLRECETRIKQLHANRAEDWRSSIPLCEKELGQRQAALDEALGTYELSQKVKFLRNLLLDVRTRTITKVRATIQARTNEKLKSLVHAEPLQIDAIGESLIVSGEAGQKDDVSVGQSLVIAYAFLTSLFEHASYRLPFVVDSPAGPIDVETRQSVSTLLPEMFPQLIMFVQSGERAGFVESFYERNDVQYVTCWKESGEIHMERGLEAFKSFHLSDESDFENERAAS